jgi:hypothetical protein
MRATASITPTGPAPAARPRLAQADRQVGARAVAPPPGRALALVESAPGTAVEPAGSRPSAVFLAQLIATAQQAPQTRRRRRAEPHEAATAYAAATAPATRIGSLICRSM